ncbi:MAG: DUF1566 domain-containing protein [Proteobacteria bacterium]|nr:DUF1566 domain-containing protein [Pseudomonadota bacterium]
MSCNKVPEDSFKDNGDGTVTDTRTGVIWLKNANSCPNKFWHDAMAYCSNLQSGDAGLTDGSVAGDWRLPSKEELQGIGTDPPATWEIGRPFVWTMPGEPFTDVQSDAYWSGTTEVLHADVAWLVGMKDGQVGGTYKSTAALCVWPVRAGN